MSIDRYNHYQRLGKQLKRLRERYQKSRAEVSGAVEIDEEVLAEIEQGNRRPAEDILLLLINHFDLRDEEANRLWSLAGYERPAKETDHGETTKQMAVLMPIDNRVVFTDNAVINGNPDSVIVNFMQTDLLSYQSIPVSRVGMSTEQAKRLFEQLRQVLYYHNQPKALPAPRAQASDSKETKPQR